MFQKTFQDLVDIYKTYTFFFMLLTKSEVSYNNANYWPSNFLRLP